MGSFFTFLTVVLVLGCLVLVLLVFFIARLFKGGGAGTAEDSRSEAQMIQELYQGLSRMENRIETLETLLLDRERPNSKGDGGAA